MKPFTPNNKALFWNLFRKRYLARELNHHFKPLEDRDRVRTSWSSFWYDSQSHDLECKVCQRPYANWYFQILNYSSSSQSPHKQLEIFFSISASCSSKENFQRKNWCSNRPSKQNLKILKVWRWKNLRNILIILKCSIRRWEMNPICKDIDIIFEASCSVSFFYFETRILRVNVNFDLPASLSPSPFLCEILTYKERREVLLEIQKSLIGICQKKK